MRIALLALLVLAGACAAPGKEGRHLGLLYDREQRPEGDTVQFRPFYWKQTSERGTRTNILGPIILHREDKVFERLQILNTFYTARKKPEKLRTWWFTFFPFLFMGNDDFLLLPVGGYSKGILGFNELLMITPFYIRSKRITSHPTDPVTFTTRAILLFLAWGSDGRPHGRRKFRIWPLYGRSDGPEGGKEGFVLWPLFTWSRNEKKKTSHFLLIPFYGRHDTPTVREKTILFPFYHQREDLLTGATDVAVWPFWRRAKGSDGLDVRRAWPFYEFRRVGYSTAEYLVWPLLRRTYVDEPHQFGRYLWMIPFYRNVHLVSRKDGSETKKTIVWPLARSAWHSSGESEFGIPSLLPVDARSLREMTEPLRPFLRLYYRHTKANGERETSALFGLLQTRQSEKAGQVRLLGGLLGWDRTPQGRYLRLLWGIRIRLGDTK